MIKKIISGGQTGADIAGVKAAKAFGIETGGTLPKGFTTLEGKRPEYAVLYGMKEHADWRYPPRTEQNVSESDGTMRFAFDFNSPGELCTLKAIRKLNKHHFNIDLKESFDYYSAIEWLNDNNIEILNIAGNAEKYVGTYKLTYEYVSTLLRKLGFIEMENNDASVL